MAVTCFPDNTVLINFGYINRIPLLGELLANRMWCLTVSRECKQSYTRRGFTTYPDVRALFGDPLIPTQAERINTRRLRDDMATPTDGPDDHMGEAETIVVAKNQVSGTLVLATDDLGATKFAKQEGLRVVNTWYLLKVAVRTKRLTEQQAWQDACLLRRNRRGWPKGIGHSQADFIAWLRET